MAHAATAQHVEASAKDHSFVWRRLHSLSGVLPVGAFLLFHIFENMAALKGPAAYDEMVRHVNEMLPKPYFLMLEFGAILMPITFHALYGIYIGSTGRANTNRYPYASNWAYWMQRISGYVAFFYLLIHVGVLRFIITLTGKHLASFILEPGVPNLVTYADVAAHLGNPNYLQVDTILAGNHMFVAYLLGSVLSIYHFTNGLNGFAWTWGLVTGRKSQKYLQWVTWGLFAVLAVVTVHVFFTLRMGVGQ